MLADDLAAILGLCTGFWEGVAMLGLGIGFGDGVAVLGLNPGFRGGVAMLIVLLSMNLMVRDNEG